MVKRREKSKRAKPTSDQADGSSKKTVEHSASAWMLSSCLRPAAAFLVATLIVWAFFVPVDATSVFQGQALAQNLFWIIAACLCGAAAMQGGFTFGRVSWAICLGALAWLIFVSVQAGGENNPRQAWNGFWQVNALASCYFCTRGIIVGPKSRAAIVGVCLAGCVASSVHGLYQVQIEIPAARVEYLRNPDAWLSAAGLDAPLGSPQRIRYEKRLLDSSEPFANFALTNSLATTLSAGVLILFAVLATSVARKNEVNPVRAENQAKINWGAILALIVSLGVVLLCWFLTLSRSAWVAVLISALFGLLLYGLRHKRSGLNTKNVGIGISVVLVLLVSGAFWLVRNDKLVISETRKSLDFRLEYWDATLRMIGEHGLFGVGLGNFQSYYPYYKLALASEEIADPHNWILDIAATLSLPIAIAIFMWLVFNFVKGIGCALSQAVDDQTDVPTRSSEIDQQSSTAIALGAVMGGFICAFLLWLLLNVNLAIVLGSWVPALVLVIVMWPLLLDFANRYYYLLMAAVLSMLVCLLASGSWQASGISVPLLLLIAASQKPTSTQPQSGRFAIALPLIGLALFLYQAWLPVNNSWSFSQQALIATSSAKQLALAKSAVEADWLDTGPQAWFAQGKIEQAKQAGRGEFERLASQATLELDAWLERDRRSFTNWRHAGNLTLDLCASAQRHGIDFEIFIKKAIEYYSKAVERYPTSVELRAQLAGAAAMSRDWELSEDQIRRAISLSEATPHLDKKLGAQLIYLPFSGLPAEIKAQATGMVNAEPLVEWIRKQRDD